LFVALGAGPALSCQRDHEQKPAPAADPAAERRTLEQMLALLDDRGLAFDAPLPAEADEAQRRAVLELQTTLQTELELARRKNAKAEQQDSVLLLQTRAALDQGQLAAFIRQRARAENGTASDATLLFTELESALRQVVRRRLDALGH
jgi:hypothetical protein